MHQSITCGTHTVATDSDTNTWCATYVTLTNDITRSITCNTLAISITSDPNTQYITYSAPSPSEPPTGPASTAAHQAPSQEQRRPPHKYK